MANESTPVPKQNNAILIAGIALPVTLIALFVLAGVLSPILIPNPNYDVLLSNEYQTYDTNKNWAITIKRGKLSIQKRNKSYQGQGPALYLWDHNTTKTKQLEIDFDHLDNQGYVIDPTIDDMNRHTLTADPTSPDGWSLTTLYGDSGFFGGFWGGYNHSTRVGLEKKPGRFIPIDGLTNTYYPQSQLIGWMSSKPANLPTNLKE